MMVWAPTRTYVTQNVFSRLVWCRGRASTAISLRRLRSSLNGCVPGRTHSERGVIRFLQTPARIIVGHLGREPRSAAGFPAHLRRSERFPGRFTELAQRQLCRERRAARLQSHFHHRLCYVRRNAHLLAAHAPRSGCNTGRHAEPLHGVRSACARTEVKHDDIRLWFRSRRNGGACLSQIGNVGLSLAEITSLIVSWLSCSVASGIWSALCLPRWVSGNRIRFCNRGWGPSWARLLAAAIILFCSGGHPVTGLQPRMIA